MDAKDPEEPGSATDPEDGTVVQGKRRSRRVSFADTTSVHVYCRDEDFETPPDQKISTEDAEPEAKNTSLESSRDSGESDSSKDLSAEEDSEQGSGDVDDDEQEMFVRNVEFSSPGSVAGSATSNEEENFFGPVSTRLIKSGRPSLESATSCDNQDITLDSTAFSLHFRSLVKSDEELSNSRRRLKSPIGVHVGFNGSSQTGELERGNTLNFMSLIKNRELASYSRSSRKHSDGGDSDDMSLIVADPHKYDYGSLSPKMEALFAERQESLRSPFNTLSLPAPAISHGNHVTSSSPHGVQCAGSPIGRETQQTDMDAVSVSTISGRKLSFNETSHDLLLPVEAVNLPALISSGCQEAQNKSIKEMPFVKNECSQEQCARTQPLNDIIDGNRKSYSSLDKLMFNEHIGDDAQVESKIYEHPPHLASSPHAKTPITTITNNFQGSLESLENGVETPRFYNATPENNIFPMSSLRVKRRRLFRDNAVSLVMTRKGTPFRAACHQNKLDKLGDASVSNYEDFVTGASISPLTQKDEEPEDVLYRQTPLDGEAMTNLACASEDTKLQSEYDLHGNNSLAVESRRADVSSDLDKTGVGMNIQNAQSGNGNHFLKTDSAYAPPESGHALPSKPCNVFGTDNKTSNQHCPNNVEGSGQKSMRNISVQKELLDRSNNSRLNHQQPQGRLLKYASDVFTAWPKRMDKTNGEAVMTCWEAIYTQFFRARVVLPPSIILLSYNKLRRVENMLTQLEHINGYAKLCEQIRLKLTAIPKPSNISSMKQQRAVEARWLFHRLIGERAKFEVLNSRREILKKETQQLKLIVQECGTLRETFLQLQLCRMQNIDNQRFSAAFSLHQNQMRAIKDEACQRVDPIKQELAMLDERIMCLIGSFQACSVITKDLGTDEVNSAVTNHVQKAASCRNIQHHIELWEVHDINITHDCHTVFLNYMGLMSQRFTVNLGPMSNLLCSFHLNVASIKRKFPNMDADVAFEFLFNHNHEHMVCGKKIFCRETQATSFLFGNLLEVLEELKQAQMQLPYLTLANFQSPSSDQLYLHLHFVDIKNGGKMKLIIDMMNLRWAAYPSEICSYQMKIKASGSCTSLRSRIASLIQCLDTGPDFILRLCQCVSLEVSSTARHVQNSQA